MLILSSTHFISGDRLLFISGMPSTVATSSRRNSVGEDARLLNEIPTQSVIKRKVLSRVTRYDLDENEQDAYDNFVNMLATFDFDTITDILEDAGKDARNAKLTEIGAKKY